MNPFEENEINIREILEIHRNEKKRNEAQTKEMCGILIQTISEAENSGGVEKVAKYFTLALLKDILKFVSDARNNEKVDLETKAEMVEFMKDENRRKTLLEQYKSERNSSNWRLMSLTEQKGLLEYFLKSWPDKKTNPFLPTHPIEGSLSRLLSERQKLDIIDRKIAKLCSTAEKCHMKDDDLREKLNEILSGEDEQKGKQPGNPKNTLALVEFKRVKIAYIDNLFGRIQDLLLELNDKIQKFEESWKRFYLLLREKFPKIGEEELVEHVLPNLSDYFVIRKRRRVIANSSSTNLSLKDLGKRKPCEELPELIRELSEELGVIVSSTQEAEIKIEEIVQQRTLMEKYLQQEVPEYSRRIYLLYKIDQNFIESEKCSAALDIISRMWMNIDT